MYVLPNVNLRYPVRILVANTGATPVTPSFQLFFTNAREIRPNQYQLGPAIGAIPANGTWRSTLTFLDVGVGSEAIDGQVQISFDGDDAQVAVQYEYDEIVRTTVRLNAVRIAPAS
jgi:hypothetical protein